MYWYSWWFFHTRIVFSQLGMHENIYVDYWYCPKANYLQTEKRHHSTTSFIYDSTTEYENLRKCVLCIFKEMYTVAVSMPYFCYRKLYKNRLRGNPESMQQWYSTQYFSWGMNAVWYFGYKLRSIELGREIYYIGLETTSHNNYLDY